MARAWPAKDVGPLVAAIAQIEIYDWLVFTSANGVRYFAERLAKAELNCFQAYPGRGAFIGTEIRGERCVLSGEAVTVIRGRFNL